MSGVRFSQAPLLEAPGRDPVAAQGLRSVRGGPVQPGRVPVAGVRVVRSSPSGQDMPCAGRRAGRSRRALGASGSDPARSGTPSGGAGPGPRLPSDVAERAGHAVRGSPCGQESSCRLREWVGSCPLGDRCAGARPPGRRRRASERVGGCHAAISGQRARHAVPEPSYGRSRAVRRRECDGSGPLGDAPPPRGRRRAPAQCRGPSYEPGGQAAGFSAVSASSATQRSSSARSVWYAAYAAPATATTPTTIRATPPKPSPFFC